MTTRGTSHAGTLGQPSANIRTTRSVSRQATAAPVPTGGGNASPGDKIRKKPTVGEQSRHILTEAKCLGPEEQVAPRTQYKILSKILDKYDEGINSNAKLALHAFVALLQENENHEQISNKMMDNIAKRVEAKLEGVLDGSLTKMSGLVESLVANQKVLQEATDSLAGKTEALQKLATDLGSSAKEASASTDQLSSTVSSYKEALITASKVVPQDSGAQPTKNNEDPRLTRDLDRRNRQILIEMGKDTVEGKSASELKERIDSALQAMDPAPPEGAKVQEINKLRNGGVIVLLATKEAADWLREPFNKLEFTEKLDDKAYIKDRTYPLVVPRIPISFEINDEEHLREVEVVNNLAPKTICKARWIKPLYRRHAKQRVAYATISLNSASEANRLIRDGMYICNVRTYPKRLKYEPKQCMKCRRWGHFASECQAKADTCGTCGENHATKDCTNKESRFCVACRATDHASWDRMCPEFQRKSTQFDEIHPENALTYFPTEESWTLTARPERVPLESRFPSKYAVGSLPLPSHTKRQMPTRVIERKQKRKLRSTDTTQGTLDRYVEKRAPEIPAEEEEVTEDGQYDNADEEARNHASAIQQVTQSWS